MLRRHDNQDAHGQVQLVGLVEHEVPDVKTMFEIIEDGNKVRRVGTCRLLHRHAQLLLGLMTTPPGHMPYCR